MEICFYSLNALHFVLYVIMITIMSLGDSFSILISDDLLHVLATRRIENLLFRTSSLSCIELYELTEDHFILWEVALTDG